MKSRRWSTSFVITLTVLGILAGIFVSILPSQPAFAADSYTKETCLSTKNGDRDETGKLGNLNDGQGPNGYIFSIDSTGTHCLFSEAPFGTSAAKYDETACTGAGGIWAWQQTGDVMLYKGCVFALPADEAEDAKNNQETCITKFPDQQENIEGVSVTKANPEYKACIDGADNKNDGYCDKYSDSLDKAACVFGQTGVYNAPTDTTSEDPCYAADTQGFGWVACPGINWLTRTIDWIVEWITGGLQWTMLVDNGSSVTIKSVWNSMLGIANIAFAIVFLIIIYSTATSAGLSNYGVKKILPRLVVAAIGVNLSFYICAAAADLSNIAGVGVKSLILDQLTGANNVGQFGDLLNGVWQLAGGILIALLTWSMVLIGLITVFFAIALRSVLLTMLVIISPIAIVAALLPNTEKWFKKWRDTFIQLLIVYPAFMAAWAACRLVGNIVAQTEGIGWLLSALCTIAPLAIIIPLFKATSGVMGKMTSLTEKGIGAAGGNALKGLNKKSNAYLRDRGARVAKNAVAGRISEAGQEAGERAKEVAALEKKKAESWTQADDARLKSLNDRVIAGETLVGDELKEHNALAQKQVAHASGAIQDWGASDEAELGKARTAKAEADRIYSRRANGLLRKGVFMASDMRFNKANREAETKRTEQSELARRLSQDDAYRARYAGVTAGMSAAEADARMNRALNQASAIGNKASEEERSNFGSLLSDASTLSDSEKGQFGTAENFSNAMAANLVKDPDYEVTISNNGVERKLSWKTMTDNERLVVFQQAASMGSSPEVATTSNALDTGKLFDDPALQNAAASMVVKSGNKGFWVQGANVANLAAGKVTTAAQKTINVTKAPIAAGVMSSFDKGAHWGDVVASMPDVAALAAKPGPEGDDARASLTNLRNAIRANLSQPGGSRYVAAVGSEYREILRAAGVDDADIEALFNSTGADADMVSDAMTRKETKANAISPKLMT